METELFLEILEEMFISGIFLFLLRGSKFSYIDACTNKQQIKYAYVRCQYFNSLHSMLRLVVCVLRQAVEVGSAVAP